MQRIPVTKAWARFSETNIASIAVLPSTATLCIRVIGTILLPQRCVHREWDPEPQGRPGSGSGFHAATLAKRSPQPPTASKVTSACGSHGDAAKAQRRLHSVAIGQPGCTLTRRTNRSSSSEMAARGVREEDAPANEAIHVRVQTPMIPYYFQRGVVLHPTAKSLGQWQVWVDSCAHCSTVRPQVLR